MVSYSSLLTATSQLPVLLVVTPAAPASHSDIDRLIAKAKSVLDPAVQVMRINETTHPEVVRSFGFTALPGFVLLQRGLELWRHTGVITGPELFHQLGIHMKQAQTKPINGQSL